MPLKPGNPKTPRSEPRQRKGRDTVVEETDRAAGGHRDLVHGEGGTLAIPTRPEELSGDD